MIFGSKAKRDKPVILHVDDEKLNRDLMRDLLGDYGAEVLSAEGGADGVKMALKHLPNLILMDITMPGVNGFDACKAIKSDSACKDIPIIMLTGMDQLKDVEKAFAFGASGYITKPIEIQRLHDTLDRWLPKSSTAPRPPNQNPQ